MFVKALHRDELPRRSSAKYRKFFNCVAVIMEEQLRGLFLRSIEEFFNYLHNKNVSYIFATRRDWKEKKPGKEIIMKLWHSIIKIRYLSFFLFYIRFIIFCIIIVLLRKKPNLKIWFMLLFIVAKASWFWYKNNSAKRTDDIRANV